MNEAPSAHEPPRDDELLQRARSGDSAALEMLLLRIAPSVQRFGLRMCRNTADADDVLQDTLLLVAKHLDEFQGRASLSSWAFSLARSACARRRRGLKNRPGVSLDAVASSEDPAPSPEGDLQRRQLSEWLGDALDSLSDEHREVIALRDIEGLSAKDAAAALGISVDALKSRLHRAREALRATLRPMLEQHAPAPDPECPDVVAMFSHKVEDELSSADCARMEDHVAGCRACGAACDALKQTLAACRSEATDDVSVQVRARVKAALAELRSTRR